jgi:type IV secretion system protein VirB11
MNGMVTPLYVGTSGMLDIYLNPIAGFLLDPELTEICINRPGEAWTENKAGWTRYAVEELTLDHCRQLATLIASYNAKSVSSEKPILSAALPTGERVQVILPPACEANTVSITVRKPSLVEKTLDCLETEGAFHQCQSSNAGMRPFEQELIQLKEEGRIREFLDMAVERHRNIVLVGKTGSGKTTVMRALAQCIPLDERLITIEDVPEITLRHHANKVHLFYGREGEGGMKVTARQALMSCLRMKPDRILLAEMRGDEAWEFIKSINTGHPGSISTMHANGAHEAFEQLTALIKDTHAGAHLATDYILHRLKTTIDIVLYYERRQLREIYYEPEHKYGE